MAEIEVTTQLPVLKDVVRGGTYTLNINCTHSDGSPFDLTGSTVYFTVNSSSTPPIDATDSTAAIATSTSSFVSPLTGVATITLTDTMTDALSEGKYFYDVKVKDANGNMSPARRNRLNAVDNLSTRTS